MSGPTAETTPARAQNRALTVAVLVLFGLLYAYFLWQAIGTAFLVPQLIAEQYAVGINTIGWIVLALNVLAAPLCFGAALLLGRHRRLGARALILAAGLCVLSAVTLTLVNSPSFVNIYA